MAPRGNNRRRRSTRTSDSEAEAVETNPYRPGTNAHGAWERMRRRRERDKAFAKTAEGKKSALEHNATPIEEADLSVDAEDFDPIEHEGRGTSVDDMTSGTEA